MWKLDSFHTTHQNSSAASARETQYDSVQNPGDLNHFSGRIVRNFDRVSSVIDGVVPSLTIDDVELIDPTGSLAVRFGRTPGFGDSLNLLTSNASHGVRFVIRLPVDYWGAGPYSLEQVLDVKFSDHTDAPGAVEIALSSFPGLGFAGGNLTDFTIIQVPEPSTYAALTSLAFVGLGLYRRRKQS